jgi:hypothetical protein
MSWRFQVSQRTILLWFAVAILGLGASARLASWLSIHGVEMDERAVNAIRLTPSEAIEVAANYTGGRGSTARLAQDHNRWVYIVETRRAGTDWQVRVDSATGQVVDVQPRSHMEGV